MPRREGAGSSSGQPASQIRRAAGRLGLLGVLLGYAGLGFALAYRPDAADGMGEAEVALSWLSLMGLTFLPHAGVALALWLVGCVLVRARRVALLGVPLLAISLGPWGVSLVPRGGAAAGRSEDSLLVLSANLLGTSASDVELLEQIGAHGPDVILLQEVRPESFGRLEAALSGDYASVAVPREHLFGGAIFSRLAFSREPVIVYPSDMRDLPQPMAWVEWRGREVCVWNIHLLPPTGRSLVAGQASFAQEMGPVLDGVLGDGGGVIVAGDFNAPWVAQPLDAVRERGFREAHRVAGSGPGSSWPARGLLSLPPGIRIDHVAYSAGLRCVEAWVGEATSSDHRPNFARLVWDDAARGREHAEGAPGLDG